MTKFLVAIVIIANFIISPIVYAHPGRTNKQGCHTCRTNCAERWNLEYDEYHCHDKKAKVKTKAKKQTRREARRSSR